MKSFAELQAELEHAWIVNRPGSDVNHVIVVLPSYSIGEPLPPVRRINVSCRRELGR